ncbi:lipid droplet-associated protein [Williamsia deligens]|uniref:Lipid droplet-associated protein n=1 Tax=Williamsia deligens TaxID=321325 RepID=A0ABW3G9T2_9NOCA|nr:lipid droplet-associated protein [Williamsia deligens]
MIRPPFAARVMTGLLVTAIEETRKLPTTAVTLPMTAVSTTVQVAMRLQQNIAELAIKGDDALDSWFHRAEEQPSWATFDEDLPHEDLRDDFGDEDPTTAVTSLSAVPDPTPAPAAEAPTAPAEKAPAKKTSAEKAPPATAPAAKSAPAKKAPATKAPAAKSAATKAPAKKSAPSTGDAPSGDGPAGPDADAITAKGRFALYSAAPDTVLRSEVDADPTPTPADAPEIVEFLDYDSLTLAQLRAKIRSIDVDDLRTLVDYERSHRGRAPFATMLDNRIAAAGAK